MKVKMKVGKSLNGHFFRIERKKKTFFDSLFASPFILKSFRQSSEFFLFWTSTKKFHWWRTFKCPRQSPSGMSTLSLSLLLSLSHSHPRTHSPTLTLYSLSLAQTHQSVSLSFFEQFRFFSPFLSISLPLVFFYFLHFFPFLFSSFTKPSICAGNL